MPSPSRAFVGEPVSARRDGTAGPAEALQLSLLEEWGAVEALGEQANQLLRRSAADSIFLTQEWAAAWRRAAGVSVRPLVLAARDADGRLVGFVRLYRTSLRLFGFFPLRALRPLGDVMSGAEYPDLVLESERERDVAAALGAALAARRDWDCLWLANVSGWTGARDRLLAAFEPARCVVRERDRGFSALALPGSYAAYTSSCLSANARSTLQRRSRQVLAGPDVAFVECRTPDELPAWLDALFALNHQRWTSAGMAGTFVRKPEEARFYREFAPVALARGWLRFYGLRIAGTLAAVQFGYAYGGVFHQMQEGYDPSAPKGLGNVLRGLVFERCIAEGLRAYDFLGEHTEHKRRWGAQPRTGRDVFVGRRSSLGALVVRAKLWPTGRFLRPVVPR